MPAMPRIYRSTPHGPITTAATPIAVIVTLRWMTSEPTDVLAQAVAWTRTEVQVEWQFEGRPRQDWIDAADVRRHGHARPQPEAPAEPSTRPPRLDTRRRPRW
jgi:hypothetical protein